jgi:hypothetical protein
MFEAHITQDAYPGVIQTADDVEVKQKGPGRTRVALIAGATALLLGVGIFGVSHFHSARPPLTTRPPLAEPAYPVIKVIKSQPLPPPSDASLDSLFSAEKKSAPASVHKVVPPHHVKHPKTVKKAPKMATVQPNAVVQKKDTVAVQPKAQPTAKDTLVKTHKGPKTLVELINELRQHNKEKKENAAKNAKK